MVAEILTRRLRLRPFVTSDLDRLTEIFAKPEVWRFPFGRGFTEDETRLYLHRRLALQEDGVVPPAAAEDRTSGRLIGYVALVPPDWLPEVMPSFEIGWRLDPPEWGKGLASEGARAVLAHAFEVMELDEVLSIYQPENVASGRVMDKIGLAFDHMTSHPFFGVELEVRSMSRAQWEAEAP